MNSENRLLFVYNADSGLFNTMADIGHKIFSPQTYSCLLCALTHGYFRERDEWRRFVDDNPVLCATPGAIRQCRSLEALKLLITEHCQTG